MRTELRKVLKEKFREAAASVLPVSILVFLVSMTPLVGVTRKEAFVFVVSAAFLVVGIALFNLGADLAMTPMGQHIGEGLTKSRRLGVLLFSALIMGILITVAEPDLSVLAEQVSAVIDGTVLIVTVGVGVGLLLLTAVLKIVLKIPLMHFLAAGYALSLGLSFFVPRIYTAIAFDSGGVASGPLTTGFILPFAIGACVRLQGGDMVLGYAFGIVAMVAMAPLITIQTLGFRSVVSVRARKYAAIRQILSADDDQIIYF